MMNQCFTAGKQARLGLDNQLTRRHPKSTITASMVYIGFNAFTIVKKKKKIASCRSANENTSCAFQLFTPFLTSVSLLETKRPFSIVASRADRKHRPSAVVHIYSLWRISRLASPVTATSIYSIGRRTHRI